MNQIYQEIVLILTTPPGNLVYHLVLAFSIAGALQASLNHWRLTLFIQSRRTVIGLSLLLGLRFILFVLAGFAWQGLVNEHALLPPVDRAIALLGIILVLWIWAFPEPSRRSDAATLILGLLALTAFVLNLVWWMGQSGQADYNPSLPGQASEIAAALLAALGILLLLVRKPNGWGFGAAMLALLLAGHLAVLLLPLDSGDYHGLVRLAQMAAYPLLLALPQRFPLSQAPLGAAVYVQQPERRKYGADPQLLENLLSLSAGAGTDKLCATITHTISQAMLADVCLLVSSPDPNGDMIVQCGYDLIREQPVEGYLIAGEDAPLVASALSRGLPLRLPASSTSTDLKAIADGFRLPRPGHLLAAPILDSLSTPLYGLLLLSPHSERGWTTEDQDLLTSLAGSLAHLLQPERPGALHRELDETRQALQAALSELDELRKEQETYLSMLDTDLTPGERDRNQAESLATMIAAQEETQELLASLQVENEQLRRNLLERPETAGLATDSEHYEGELRLALEEVASLKSALSQADQKFLLLENQQESDQLPGTRAQEIAGIVQDLRQPMSSILGYTEFLLGESVGILGNLQRKFLERIRQSSQRINDLVQELYQFTGLENGRLAAGLSIVDPNQVIDSAIANASTQLRQKNIILRLDLPNELPPLHASQEAFQRALLGLLQNAGGATSQGGEIALSARLQSNEGHSQYLLIQVTDQGGGIPAEHASRLFSRLPHLEPEPIPGTGAQSAELTVVKILIENLGGRIWVDSSPGVGSTFSVLLPVARDPVVAGQPYDEDSGGLPG
ncbi:MAG TPA: ATP-binding protein [Anaerolineales bacterium]|nr:ATP-binding protein [Anaerolineales bacterium]